METPDHLNAGPGSRRNHQGQRTERVTSRNHEACRHLRPDLIACPTLRRPRSLYLCRRCPRPLPAAPQAPSPKWSRPLGIDGCSAVARMPRYGPALPGIRSAPRIPAAGQNGSSRHALALFGSSSRRINEHRSGLLICGFGVQVPGGAPTLTWSYTHFGVSRECRFVAMFAPRLLVSPDLVAWPGQARPADPLPMVIQSLTSLGLRSYSRGFAVQAAEGARCPAVRIARLIKSAAPRAGGVSRA